MQKDNIKFKIFAAVLLVSLGVMGRFLLVSYVGMPNFEIISALSLVAGIYLGGMYSIIVPISTIFLSDLAIGNSGIIIFTWTAFAIIGLIGSAFRRRSYNISFGNSIFLAMLSSVFFYVYTNFGWWLMSGMYEYSIAGLIKCYAAAIPFFINQLAGNLIFVPFSIYAANYVRQLFHFGSPFYGRKMHKLKNNHF